VATYLRKSDGKLIDLINRRGNTKPRPILRACARPLPLVHFVDELSPSGLTRLSRELREAGARVGDFASFVTPANKVIVPPGISDGKRNSELVQLTLPWGPKIRVHVGIVRALLRSRNVQATPRAGSRSRAPRASGSTKPAKGPRAPPTGGSSSSAVPVARVHEQDGDEMLYRRPDGSYLLKNEYVRGYPDYFAENLPTDVAKAFPALRMAKYVTPANLGALGALRQVNGRYVGKFRGWEMSIAPSLQKKLLALQQLQQRDGPPIPSPSSPPGSLLPITAQQRQGWTWGASNSKKTGWVTTDPRSGLKEFVYLNADGHPFGVSVPAAQVKTAAQMSAVSADIIKTVQKNSRSSGPAPRRPSAPRPRGR